MGHINCRACSLVRDEFINSVTSISGVKAEYKEKTMKVWVLLAKYDYEGASAEDIVAVFDGPPSDKELQKQKEKYTCDADEWELVEKRVVRTRGAK
jgi:Tfp pilus assembly major pilin PilA